MNLAQNEAQGLAGALLQSPAGLGSRRQRRRLILRRDVRQNRRLPPPHTAVAQLNPDGHILHPLQPRRRDSERCHQRHVQRSPLRSLDIHGVRLHQVFEPQARGLRRGRRRRGHAGGGGGVLLLRRGGGPEFSRKKRRRLQGEQDGRRTHFCFGV